jgi:hypothetical protein
MLVLRGHILLALRFSCSFLRSQSQAIPYDDYVTYVCTMSLFCLVRGILVLLYNIAFAMPILSCLNIKSPPLFVTSGVPEGSASFV